MDSDDYPHCSQQSLDESDHIIIRDSPVSRYGFNSSHFQNHSQFQPQNPMSQSTPIDLDHIPSQFTPVNLQYQRVHPFNPMSGPFPSHVQQQYAPGFTYQGLMHSSNLPVENQTLRTSKKKGKTATKCHTVQTATICRNWKVEEDIALTKAWVYISCDADVGTNQKLDTLWNRIWQVWKDKMGEEDATRSPNGLSCRWQTIQPAVNRFHGYYEQLERHPKSGTTPDDTKKAAYNMYQDMNDGEIFKMEHCWDILRRNPKWCTLQLTKQGVSNSRKQKAVDDVSFEDPPPTTQAMPEFSVSHGDCNVDASTVNEGENFGEVKRPEGRKAAKEREKRMVSEKGVADALGQLQCTVEKQIECSQKELELKKERDQNELELKKERDRKDYELRERTIKTELELKARNQKLKERAQRRKEQDNIMNKDLTILSPAIRQEIEALQAEILNERKNDGPFAGFEKSA